MRIILVRHCESVLSSENKNSNDIVSIGQYDTPLSKKGIDEAIMLYDEVKDYKIDKIYSSDLKRAVDTAVLSTKREDIIIDKLLRERTLGVFEGMKRSEIISKYSEIFDIENIFHDYNLKPPMGENYTDVYIRAEEFIKKLDLNIDETIIIYSHAILIKQLLRLLLNLDKEETKNIKVKNGTPIILEGKNVGDFNLINTDINKLTKKEI